jgi:hypothetical protein
MRGEYASLILRTEIARIAPEIAPPGPLDRVERPGGGVEIAGRYLLRRRNEDGAAEPHVASEASGAA